MRMSMKKLAVFCGAHLGNQIAYSEAALRLARAFVLNNNTLVYGGSKVGLMGKVADEVLRLGGEVIGVLPKSLLERELAHENLTKLYIVEDMQERKKLLLNLSDGFIMMPGGVGSLDEFFEVLTLAQLGYHQKPCGIFNVNDYYNELMSFLKKAVQEGFVKSVHEDMILLDDCIDSLLLKFKNYHPPTVVRWVNEVEKS